MNNTNNEILFCPLNEVSVETLLLELFNPSKNKLKKHFDKKFLNRIIFAKKEIQLPLEFVNDGEINPKYLGPEIKIIYEDDLFLVLDKPANIFVHPLKYTESNNCLSFLRANNFKVLNVNKENYDRGLLYRLDFETSGVLIYVKNETAYVNLRAQFNQIAREKIYYAKVAGKFTKLGLHEAILTPTGVGGSKMKYSPYHAHDASKINHENLHARLEIIDAHYNEETNSSTVQIKLLTGHRHQIRVQLSGLGFPIIGDELYGGISANRLYLHAYNYKITYENKTYDFLSEPNDFN